MSSSLGPTRDGEEDSRKVGESRWGWDYRMVNKSLPSFGWFRLILKVCSPGCTDTMDRSCWRQR